MDLLTKMILFVPILALSALQQSIGEKQPTYEQCLQASAILLDSCRAQKVNQGTNEVERKVQIMTERLSRLQKQLSKEQGSAAALKKLMATYRGQKEKVQSTLFELEEGLKKTTAFGTDIEKINTEMTRVKEVGRR